MHAALLDLLVRKREHDCNPTTATNPQPPYSVIQSDVNDGYAYYDALDVNLTHRFSRKFSMLASYTWSHAIDNVDPDPPARIPTIRISPAKWKTATRFSISGIASC